MGFHVFERVRVILKFFLSVGNGCDEERGRDGEEKREIEGR